jgi:D-serine deaminase-like pyridoxal phosphate-dependent protein
MTHPGISRPTLLLDEAKCRANIARMAAKARAGGVALRPHFKTHQSAEIAQFFRDEGITACTVSSVAMAEYFAHHGWNDITLAFPLNPREAQALNRLAAQIRLAVCAVNAEALEQTAPHLTHNLQVWIELDTGYHRTGIDPANQAAIQSVIAAIQRHPHYSWLGFLDHAGHTYACRGADHVLEVSRQARQLLVQTGSRYRQQHPQVQLSTGDTPGCSVADTWDGVNEIRPGNFVFYDLTQQAIGSCTASQIAVALACPVVALHPEREEIFLHGGAVHLSKDSLQKNQTVVFGQPVKLTDTGWTFSFPDSYVKSVSQEHGKIHWPAHYFSQVQAGDVLGIVPVHSCLTADAMRRLISTEGKIFDMMPR